MEQARPLPQSASSNALAVSGVSESEGRSSAVQASKSTKTVASAASINSAHQETIAHVGQPHSETPDPDLADHWGSRFMMTEKNPIRIAWSFVVFTLLAYVASIFLYRFAFWTFHIGPNGLDPLYEDDMSWKIVDYLVDALFWVDLVLTFFLTYRDERGREIDSFKLAAKKYVRFFFWLNLLACLPEEAFGVLFPEPQDDTDPKPGMDFRVVRVYRLQRISRLARLGRVTRLIKFVDIMRNSSLWNRFQALRGVRVVNFIGGLFWALHCLACGWYLCAALHQDVAETWVARRSVNVDGQSLLEAAPFEQWTVAMYFVLTVFTTVGFGDISAGTEGEIIYVAFTMLVGAVVHSIIISEVISIVTSTDEIQKIVAQKMALIDGYTTHTQISEETSKAMKSEIAWRAKHGEIACGFDKSEMMDLITGKYMPRWLIAQMPESLFCGRLMRNSFLHCVSTVPPRLPCLLALHLVPCDFETGEAVYQMGDYPFNLFLVMHGTFAHIARASRQGGVDAMQVDEVKIHGNGQIEEDKHPYKWASSASHLQSPSVDSQQLFPYRLFSKDSYFGDVEMLAGKPRAATTRCEKRGQTLVLHRKDFTEVEQLFPQFGAAWTQGARRRERFRVLCLAKLTTQMNYVALAAMPIQRYFRQKKALTMAEPGNRERRRSETERTTFETRIAHDRGVAKPHAGPPSELKQMQATIDSLRLEVREYRKEVLQLMKEGQTGNSRNRSL